MKNLKKIIAVIIVLSMCLTIAPVTFAAGNNSVDLSSYINNEIVDKVFVGETVKTVLSVENLEKYNTFNLGLSYNAEAIQLTALKDAPINTLYEGFDNSVNSISFSDYALSVDEVRSYVIPKLDAKELENIYGDMFGYQAPAELNRNVGVIKTTRMLSTVGGAGAVTDKTAIYEAEFTAVAPGSSNFAEITGEVYLWPMFLVAQEQIDAEGKVWRFLVGEDELALNTTLNQIQVLEKPDAPSNLTWSQEGYVLSWDAPATGCRGYNLEIYKDDSLIESVNGLNVTTYDDMMDVIKEYALGNYVVKVVAVGGTYNSDVAVSEEVVVSGFPMDKIEDAALNETQDEKLVLSWSEIDNASGYDIVVKDGENVLPGFPKTNYNGTEIDLTDVLGVGDYVIEITPVPESALYLAPETTVINYSSGSSIVGIVNYITFLTKVGNLEFRPDDYIPNPNTPVKVVLKDALNNEYTGSCDAEGNFVVEGVPNGLYSISIVSDGAVTRNLTNKIKLTKSEIINICAQDKKITLYSGDVLKNNNNNIQDNDIAKLVSLVGTAKGAAGYTVACDLVGTDEVINTFDLLVTVYNTGKGNMNYMMMNNEIASYPTGTN